MCLIKKYLKSRKACKVTFRLDGEEAKNARTIHVVGEFNGWDKYATPMKKKKDNSFTAIVELEPGKDYQFRYLVNLEEWENDWNADNYIPTDCGNCDNSVVSV
jgi:1,4-alpha-glucan branching enzyme